jgi:hypothetical protein
MAVELSTDTIKNWKGDTVEAQLDMFKHMLMFILAKEHGLDKLLSESEWVTLSLPVIEDYADFYATDMLDDVLIAYGCTRPFAISRLAHARRRRGVITTTRFIVC